MNTLLFFGELPPKVNHGISISNKRILADLNKEFEIVSIEDDSSFQSGMCKFSNIFKSIYKLMRINKDNVELFYLNCPTSVLGLIKNIIFLLIVKRKWRNVYVISHLHRGDVGVFLDGFLSKKTFDLYYKVVDRILVLSDSIVKELVKRGYNKGKFSILYNTVDNDYLSYISDDISDDSFGGYYLSLSNYIKTKNITTTLEYFKLNAGLFVHCYGSSDGLYFNELKNNYSYNNIFINGPIYGNDKKIKVRNAKAMLISSKNEGMPLVILEALSLGTPVICYDVGCIKEYLGSDYPGLVSELTDDAFFRKVSWLNSLSSSDYLALREHSRQIFWSRFSPDNIREETINVFSK
ncbi:glycosyltransferase [Vibrio fluvialis]|uniref:glycosyltransferase family 4 protein n=1 Tax=Vibrio fluvialis TaxID=676 RepID=UPI00192C133E|nr:glycosyltransferase [Vibrio fluvialis]MBL4248876.1 glycosyltransferase [Vibrio fluvialis]